MVMLALGAALFVVPVSAYVLCLFFFFSSRRRHTRSLRDWSSDVCSSDLEAFQVDPLEGFTVAAEGELGVAAVRHVVVLRQRHVRVADGLEVEGGEHLVEPRRSEERRVGKECRSGWSLAHEREKDSTRSRD